MLQCRVYRVHGRAFLSPFLSALPTLSSFQHLSFSHKSFLCEFRAIFSPSQCVVPFLSCGSELRFIFPTSSSEKKKMRDATVMFVGVISQIVGVWLGTSWDKHAMVIVDLMMCLAVIAVWILACYLSLRYALAYYPRLFPTWVMFGCILVLPFVGVMEPGFILFGSHSSARRQSLEIVVGGLVCLWLWGTIGRVAEAIRQAIEDLDNPPAPDDLPPPPPPPPGNSSGDEEDDDDDDSPPPGNSGGDDDSQPRPPPSWISRRYPFLTLSPQLHRPPVHPRPSSSSSSQSGMMTTVERVNAYPQGAPIRREIHAPVPVPVRRRRGPT